MGESKKDPKLVSPTGSDRARGLADDLFLEAQAEALGEAFPAPLNPTDFSPKPTSVGDDPTQRIDARRARVASQPQMPQVMQPAVWTEPPPLSGEAKNTLRISGDATLIEPVVTGQSTETFGGPESSEHPHETIEDGIVILGPQSSIRAASGIEVELLEPEELDRPAFNIPGAQTEVDQVGRVDFVDAPKNAEEQHPWDNQGAVPASAAAASSPPKGLSLKAVAASEADAMVSAWPEPIAHPAEIELLDLSPASGVAVEAAPPTPKRPPPASGGIRGLPLGSRPQENEASAPSSDPPDALRPQAILPAASNTSEMPQLGGFASTDASGAPIPIPELPCILLVVGDELQSATAVATRFMAHGYTCRVASGAQARAILEQEAVHAVVVDLLGPPELAAARLVGLGQLSLPTVGLGEASKWQGAPIGGFIVPEAPDAAWVGTLESTRHPLSLPAGASMDLLPALGFVWLKSTVRVAVCPQSGGQRPGRLVAVSADGRLQIEVDGEYEDTGSFDVQLTLPDGRSTIVAAAADTVVPGAVVIALRIPPDLEAFFGMFQAAVSSDTADQLDPVIIRARVSSRPPDVAPSRAELKRSFSEIRDRLDDDAAHQAFIQDCLQAQELQFAVVSYRGLKEHNPGDERVSKYLNQVGTILGFYAFKKQVDVGAPGMSSGIKWMLAGFVFLGLLSAAAAVFMSGRGG